MQNSDEWQVRIARIDAIARRVANRVNASPSVRDELAAEAVAHIWSKIEVFDPQRSAFDTRCGTVLRNLCVSMIRKEATRRKVLEQIRADAEIEEKKLAQCGAAPSPVEQREQAEKRAAVRVRADVGEILGCLPDPIDRLLLAAYTGVLSTCDAELVDDWCRDANRAPASEFLAIESLLKTQRKRAMASMLCVDVGWVRQRIYRAGLRIERCGFGGAMS